MEPWIIEQRLNHPIEIKNRMAEKRIIEWYNYFNGDVYVSFSGGLDSTYLLNLVRKLFPNVPAVFCDTGLEYPEIREFALSFKNLIVLKPEMTFKKVLEKYGYPLPTKEQAKYIKEARNTKSEKLRSLRLNGRDGTRQGMISDKWKYLLDAPFKISDECCKVMKIRPFIKYEKESGRKPFLGNMLEESTLRKQKYLDNGGCNAFKANRPNSCPLSCFRKKDILTYTKENNIPYSKIYDMGETQTGCMFCMFGVALDPEPNRFQRMQVHHPKLYDYCMNKLGLKEKLKYIKVPYKNEETLFD